MLYDIFYKDGTFDSKTRLGKPNNGVKYARNINWEKEMTMTIAEFGLDINPICPFCRYEHYDDKTGQFGDNLEDDGEYECRGCGETFLYEKTFVMLYKTRATNGFRKNENQ
jgi:transposase-like protein